MDSFEWSLSKDDEYSVSDTRKHSDSIYLSVNGPATRCRILPRKVNDFVWQVALNRLPSRLTLSTRGLEIEFFGCVSCNGQVESMDHILFECSVALDLWLKVRVWCNIMIPEFHGWNEWLEWFDVGHTSTTSKDALFVIVVCLMWHLWQWRNDVMLNFKKMKKDYIFDSICLFLFNWLDSRSKCNVKLND
ncbi:uncharacterized protein [Rutidosis leptorrhynchoides]|uniref:uncharacterized protein n=1 Tax=Rutidosis leptorrhynchoides TaxID=125765 RepID=UPI003A98DCA5